MLSYYTTIAIAIAIRVSAELSKDKSPIVESFPSNNRFVVEESNLQDWHPT